MISYLLNSFLIGILFADLLERRYPEQFRSIITHIGFNAIYLYSKTQIYFNRINKYLKDFINSDPFLSKIKNILNYENSNEIIKQFVKNGEYSNLEQQLNCDFAIYSWPDNNNKNCLNKMIIHDVNEPFIQSEYSDIKFILIEIKIGEKTYKIDLKTNEYNYYLVRNKFTKEFFIFYLKQYLKINETISQNDKVVLEIIDHNINSINIEFTNNNESIILEKNSYKISLSNENENKNENKSNN